jgi:LmbE family N-acetylglucosaminyl deacetylase
MGGTILKHYAAGDDVFVLFLTSGGLGIPDTDGEVAADIREGEAVAACDILGVRGYRFARFPDGDLSSYFNEAVAEVKGVIMEHGPRRVYTTHADEDHIDHRAAAAIVGRAVREFNHDWPDLDMHIEAMGFEVWTPLRRPSRLVGFDMDITAIKIAAIEAHKSQASRNHFSAAIVALNRYRAIMHNKNADACAEAFSPLEEAKLKVTIMLLTYTPELSHARAEYALRTLSAALANLRPGPDVELRLHIADDGSPEGHVEMLKGYAESAMPGIEITTSNSQRGGYGHNYNLACQAVHSQTDFVLALEDDWQLMRPLELTPLVRALVESYRHADGNPNHWIRCIRLGYLGFDREITGRLITLADQKFFRFDANAPEQYLFAGHARLETVEFEQAVGPWTPGLGAGATELDIIGRPQARIGICWPFDLAHTSGDLFSHIGDESVNALQPEGVHAD